MGLHDFPQPLRLLSKKALMNNESESRREAEPLATIWSVSADKKT